MLKNILTNASDNLIGNKFKIKITLATIISGGHILIEDLPGTGKTTFAKSITTSLNLDFKRIQFTSDLLPSDILGYTFLNNEKFEINKGPIFSNIILADELNRASPKTQSAFLEAMEEKTVTIDKETLKLPKPFSIIATQNPSDLSGTSLLPESQLDRFSISFSLDELDQNERIQVLQNTKKIDFKINKSFNFNENTNISNINVSKNIMIFLDNINQYIKTKFHNTHISIRSLKQTIEVSKALSLIENKNYVTYQEVKEVLPYILRHRINIVEKNEIVNFIKSEIIDKVSLPDEI